jgi:hypothetical protein
MGLSRVSILSLLLRSGAAREEVARAFEAWREG